MKILPGLFEAILRTSGIELDGSRPCDMKVHDGTAFNDILKRGMLGLGESYMAGKWDCEALDLFFERLLSHHSDRLFWLHPVTLKSLLKCWIVDSASRERAANIGKMHYDLGNDLFEQMLGPSMAYSCGYWKDQERLTDAQLAKFDLIGRKLQLSPGQNLIDIGCGFATCASYLADHFSVNVLGITVSKAQAQWYQKEHSNPRVAVEVMDYRELLSERFAQSADRVYSVGMFEHVEARHYREFMKVIDHLLKPDGLALLHTIGKKIDTSAMEPWTKKYIFPVGALPSPKSIKRSVKGLFEVRDWHEFGRFYDLTLMAWYRNFHNAWPELQRKYGGKIGGQFRRMWRYYLLSCAACFRTNSLQLWQITLSHPGHWSAYRPVR